MPSTSDALHDCVIKAMVRGLGGRIECERAPFTPEAGAYEHHAGPYDHGDDCSQMRVTACPLGDEASPSRL